MEIAKTSQYLPAYVSDPFLLEGLTLGGFDEVCHRT
jgi:hypothetical protein